MQHDSALLALCQSEKGFDSMCRRQGVPASRVRGIDCTAHVPPAATYVAPAWSVLNAPRDCRDRP